MSNLCKMSPERRIIAERVGIIPHLRRLAGKPKWAENPASRRDREERMSLRKMAVEILCSMLTVSTDKIRASLWNEGVFYLLIQIVNEDVRLIRILHDCLLFSGGFPRHQPWNPCTSQESHLSENMYA